MKMHLGIAVLGLASFAAAPALADDVTIVCGKDNTLYEDATGSVSNGVGARFFEGRTGQSGDSVRRGLIWFDVASSVPAGSRITKVVLQMHMSKTPSSTTRITELHAVLADWGEGSSDATGQEGKGGVAKTGDATWLHTFFPSALWTTPGGDFSPTASASLGVAGSGFYMWGSTTQMVADVQSWLDQPATNFGWLVLGREDASRTAKRFDTRENATAANRPQLMIEYCTPATWTNYGSGLPGTLGVPALTANGNPILCQTTTVAVGNSLGAPTPAVMFAGYATASISSEWGGTLLVQPLVVAPFALPAGGFDLTFPAPCDDSFCGVHIYLQALETDPGAINGVSFTAGIDLKLGN